MCPRNRHVAVAFSKWLLFTVIAFMRGHCKYIVKALAIENMEYKLLRRWMDLLLTERIFHGMHNASALQLKFSIIYSIIFVTYNKLISRLNNVRFHLIALLLVFFKIIIQISKGVNSNIKFATVNLINPLIYLAALINQINSNYYYCYRR